MHGSRFHAAAALIWGALVLSACTSPPRSTGAPAAAPEIRDAESLIQHVHARHAAHWYRTLAWKQTVVRSGAARREGEPEVWVEYAEIPGRLRIDFDGGASGNGVLQLADTLLSFRADTVESRLRRRNPLMVLGFEMYAQPPGQTLSVLREEGFDLSRFHRTAWRGAPMYVVGAAPGDLAAPQFWVDAERLLFVRLIQPSGPGGSRTSEVRFDRYERIAGGWIATEVVFLVDGEEVMRQHYFDMHADVRLDRRLFDPAHWREMRLAPPVLPGGG